MDMKELLEKAAKAAGIAHDGYYVGGEYVKEGLFIGDGKRWSPHINDGDSARLADVLMITTGHKVMSVYASTQMGERVIELLHDHKNDRAAARRMAVLKLAAELGDGV